MSKIKDIPLEERPVERLINSGVETLSNEELLAILIKTGNKQESSKDLAIKILNQAGNINNLKNITLEKLLQIKGIGIKKATIILSAIQLGKNIEISSNIKYNTQITSSKDVFNYYKEKLKDQKQEHFYCLYLNNSKKIITSKLLFLGTINHSLVHPREIFKEAYNNGATSIICVHNHPTGDIFPSKEDYLITTKIIEIGKIHGIEINDHIIIGKNNYYSFFDNHDL